jgi:hypothetical protein
MTAVEVRTEVILVHRPFTYITRIILKFKALGNTVHVSAQDTSDIKRLDQVSTISLKYSLQALLMF